MAYFSLMLVLRRKQRGVLPRIGKLTRSIEDLLLIHVPHLWGTGAWRNHGVDKIMMA